MIIKKLLLLLLFFPSVLFISQTKQANDCINYIQICGNQNITLNPTGYGFQEINNDTTCQGEEHNSLWLKFTVKTTGTIGFDLIPANTSITVDYDFWIFGPNASCNNLRRSIRCSTTNPEAAGSANNHTGMRDSEPDGDFFEGPGEDGDNYIKSLNVTAGESYFLVIDRPIGDGAFTLNWTGTAILDDPFGTIANPFGTVRPITVCNTNLTYDFSLFTANILNHNSDFDVTYYNTYEDATYDENRITQPQTLANHNYYYRIQSKTSECFRVETINVEWKPLSLLSPEIKACKNTLGKGLFDLTSAVLTSENVQSTTYYLTLEDAQAHIPGTEIKDPAHFTSSGGSVFAWLVTDNGCENSTEIFLNFYPTPNVDVTHYNANLCDNDLDGSISLKFSDITPLIVENHHQFEVYYYLASQPGHALANDFSISGDTKITVEVRSKDGCPSVFRTIDFKIAPKITLQNVLPVNICDADRSGEEPVDLSVYSNLFTSQATSITFYESLNDARKKINNIDASRDINASKSYFLRFENTTECPSVGELKIIFKNPRTSPGLQDIVICKENTTNLDAGSGFAAYLWDTGSKTQESGMVSIGEHWVDLTYDGCTTRQTVKVIAEEDIVIQTLDIENDKLTVNAKGGTLPYEYSMDGIHWQFPNVFVNIPKGIQRIYVRSSKKCTPSVREFSNINLLNVITPNGDGKNDVLDYSTLRLKNDVTLQIIDRYGKSVFEAKDKNYIWTGKENGKSLPTGSYWYRLQWTEPDTGVIQKHSSWILLKNN